MGLLRKLRRRDASIACQDCKRRDGEAHEAECPRLRFRATQAAAKAYLRASKFSWISTVLVTPEEASRIRLETKGAVCPRPAMAKSKRRGATSTPILGRDAQGRPVQLYAVPTLSSQLGDVERLRAKVAEANADKLVTMPSSAGKTEAAAPLVEIVP